MHDDFDLKRYDDLQVESVTDLNIVANASGQIYIYNTDH